MIMTTAPTTPVQQAQSRRDRGRASRRVATDSLVGRMSVGVRFPFGELDQAATRSPQMIKDTTQTKRGRK